MVVRLELTNGQYTLIDDDKINEILNYKWHALYNNKRKGYTAVGYVDGQHVALSRYLLNCPKEMQVDHINNDPLDNRMCNIRICSRIENMRNKGFVRKNKIKFKGVQLKGKRWAACICKKHLGTFDTPEEAARVCDVESKRIYGEYAWLNFPDKPINIIIDKESIPIVKQKKYGRALKNTNTSGFIGIVKLTNSNRWAARFTENKKIIRIGTANNKEKAALMYDNFIKEHPEYNRELNFQDESSRPDIDLNKPEVRNPLSKRNTSGYRGVTWSKKDNMWISMIIFNKETLHGGYFNNKINAALAYDDLALKCYGSKAILNFPDIENRPEYVYDYENRKNILPKSNKSGYLGVTYIKQQNNWRATLSHNKNNIVVGGFNNKIDAALHYDDLVVIYKPKDKMKLNFPVYSHFYNFDKNFPIQLIPINKQNS